MLVSAKTSSSNSGNFKIFITCVAFAAMGITRGNYFGMQLIPGMQLTFRVEGRGSRFRVPWQTRCCALAQIKSTAFRLQRQTGVI